MSNINAEYQKWYDRFTKGIATKERHIDVLLEKGVITQEEYDSIINQTGYVERTTEPTRTPSKIEKLETKVATIETNTSSSAMTNSMLLLQVANLENEKKELQDTLNQIESTNSMLLLQMATLTQTPTVE